ncbi:hypothetical protein [Arthrobacter sp. StoSoilB5]|uniref:hypothetical protein n=1 Tax=Arthrobacter sp. StoSoilB5 TaxID=2830992 RepID=UPI001CC6AD12|nr:hypothetical protein [Arthrobacter sp. StoSoilB5]
MSLSRPLDSSAAARVPFSPISEQTLANIGAWLDEMGRLGYDFVTGPPMAGLFAVLAATVAYRGIKQQVAKAESANQNVADANAETARKNGEDQWWTVLQWAYEQASKDGTPANHFKEKAVLGIFESLAVPGLSAVQTRALDRITAVFEDKHDPETATQLSNLRQAVNESVSTSTGFTALRRSVLTDLTFSLPTGLTRVFAHGQNAPFLYRTKKGTLVGVQPLWIDEDGQLDPRERVRDAAAEVIVRQFEVSEKPRGAGQLHPNQRVSRVLIASNAEGYWPNGRGEDPPHVSYHLIPQSVGHALVRYDPNRLDQLRQELKALADI